MAEPLLRTLLVTKGSAVPGAPQPRLQYLGFYESTARYRFHRHQHLAFETIVPTRGRYRCRLNGEAIELARGSVLLVQPRDWHEDVLDRGVGYWALGFALEDASLRTVGGWFHQGVTSRQQVCAPPRSELTPLLQRLRRESGRGDAFSPLVQDALLAEIVWMLARAFPPQALAPALAGITAESSVQARLERAFAAHLHRRFAVSEMARALGMGRSALGEACRRSLGLSPARAFARYRLDRAHALLSRTAMSVVEVSEHLGFENPFHFSRAFKRRWGHPPSQVARRRS